MVRPVVTPSFVYNPPRELASGRSTGFADTFVATVKRDFVPIMDATMESYLFSGQKVDPNFNFTKAVTADPFLDHYATDLAHAKNQEHFDFLANSLKENQERRDKLENSGFFTSLFAEALSPVNLLFAFPAVGVAARASTGLARIGQSGVAGAKAGLYAGVSIEAMRYPFDQLETGTEAALNIGGSAVFGGILGAGVPAAVQLGIKSIPALRNRVPGLMKKAESDLEVYNMRGADYGDVKIVDISDSDMPTGSSIDPKDQLFLKENAKKYREALQLQITSFAKGAKNKDAVKFVEEYNAVSDRVEAKRLLDENKLNKQKKKPAVFPTERVRLEKKELIDPETGEITSSLETFNINKKQISEEFSTGSYADAEVSGGVGIPRGAFENEQQYIDFLYVKENILNSRTEGLTEDEAFELLLDGDFIDEVNTFARADIARGWGTVDNAFTKWHMFGSPAFNILRDPKMPEGIKQLIAGMTGNNQIAYKRNTAGFGTNAVDQRMSFHTAAFRDFAFRVDNHWAQATKGRDTIKSKTINFSFDDAIFVPNNRDEWFASELSIYIQTRDGGYTGAELTKTQKALHKDIKKFFDDYLALSQDEGMFLGIIHYDNAIAKVKQQKNDIEIELKASGATDALSKRIDLLEDEIAYLKEARRSARSSERYNIPRFYNVLELKKRGQMYDNMVEMLTEEFDKTPMLKTTDDTGRVVDRDPKDIDARIDAISVVNKIIQDENMPTSYTGSGGSKGRHLKARALNIPDSKLEKFLVKDLTVFASYAETQGFNIAWRNIYGTKSLDDVLNDIVLIGQREGATPSQIAKAKQALTGDYLRTTNAHRGSPHRWDNQIGKVMTGLANWTRLAGSGVTAFADVANTIAARPFTGMGRDMITDYRMLMDVVDDVDTFTEVLSYYPNLVKDQMVGDAKSGVQSSLADKITHYPDKLWFNTPIIGNDLMPITSATRTLAAVYNTSDITKLILKSFDDPKSVTRAELQQLGELGLNPKVRENIYKQLKEHHQVSDSGRVFFANTRSWDMTKLEGRDALQALGQAIDIATDAHVLMAKNFDKPRIVDGFAYVPFHPVMKVLGMSVDPRASYQGKKYAKVSSGFLKFPFQFLNYSMAATNSVVGRSFDPNKERRLQHVASSIAAGLGLLMYQKEDWWFENKSYDEIMMRAIDRSGVMGVYGDIIYESVHTAIGFGADPDSLPVRGKYRPTGDKKYDFLYGPAPTQFRDLAIAAKDYINNNNSKHARALSRQLPWLQIGGIELDYKDLHDLVWKK